MKKSALLALTLIGLVSSTAGAMGTLHVYGPGGPLPAMKEAASAFGTAKGIDVDVVGGPTPQWLDHAKGDADIVFGGSEIMMSDFLAALPDLMPATVTPLYLRPSAILVRPGNPNGITGFADLLKPGHRILVVNGSGQQGLWEDVAGRLGRIETVRAFRANIAAMAKTSAEAKTLWQTDKQIDAWLIWNIWQTANPQLADLVAIEPDYRIYRDTAAALTHKGLDQPEARAFLTYLSSPEAASIFRRWGWITADQK